ncbi:MAG: NAD(P)/FAD-dependent oxidoreductase [Phycisphaerales bacterium]|nr:NAD(P)/FAD-dependent oxidoreductase [Phycisphaerales bacterium]
MRERADIVVVGAGAAGLFAAIWAARALRARVTDEPAAGRSADESRVIVLDGARKIGAKILVAGGGRCNVTHHAVGERDYAGSTPGGIRSVLRRFGVEDTIAFFRERGVELKREATGKLFPVSDRAQDVLDALLDAAGEAGAEVRHPARVESIERIEDGFVVRGAWGEIGARRVVLATGGMALPATGSDGAGYAFARTLGHTTTARIVPALVPLIVEEGSFVRGLSGLAADVALEVRGGGGKRLTRVRGSMLCTHFGVSGPAALDVSRHYFAARAEDAAATLHVCWTPEVSAEEMDHELVALGGGSVRGWLRERTRDALAERLVDALLDEAGVSARATGATLTRETRRSLVRTLTEMELRVTGDRGFKFAEVTAGGVPLAEVSVKTMESRACAGLHLCGEVLDVDGRIGGFNFQWAWASGYVAGLSAVEAHDAPREGHR